ncbi:TolC family protein [uncultured Fibrobacter sp.]|uniref:TolC family protein n=1 Tax=uncultured Fibrobacter sp. TaxID=261512 RepID=UPI0025D1765C|nr:TolC family protein [uncultured Fibrobacter sp.]
MKKCGYVFLLLAAPLLAAPLTWETLIKSADDDLRYQSSKKRTNIATSRNTKLWDKMELRYKLDGFSFASHDFELRMTPKAFGEGSADRAHYEAQMVYANAQLAEDRGILLYDRYERAIHYLMRQRINRLNKELYQVNSDRIEVLHMKAGSASFNPQDLMSALEKEATIRAALISDSNSLQNSEKKLRRWIPDFDGIELDSSWLPSMEEIESQLSGGIEVNDNYPQLAMAKGKMESEKARAKQDVASRRDYITHIGIGYSMKIESLMEKYKDLDAGDVAYEYNEYMDDYLEKYPDATADDSRTIRKLVADKDSRKTCDKFYATLGIKLPFFDSNKDNDLRNQVADLDAESDYMAKARDVNVKVNRLVEQVNGYLAQWKVQKDFADKVKAGNIFEQFAKDAGSDPLLLLRARESALESELNAAKLETTIYDLYLELLQYAGKLSKEGVQNHLVGGLK